VDVQTSLIDIQSQFDRELSDASTLADLEALKVKFLGKKGTIQELMRNLKDADPAERPLLGKGINDLKEAISQKLEHKQTQVGALEQASRLAVESIDITLPGRRRFLGRKHLIPKVLEEMLQILKRMGFSIQYGPDIDSDFYNFEALNLGPDHPARDMQDTFYITDNMLLRTHTSNVQVRLMENQKPPIRVVSPGKAFRNEDVSARSHVFFHQLEAFYIDKGVTFGDLLATMEEFLKKLFSADIQMRVRPSYFPFVEPGMEVDVQCISCKGVGCPLCKQTGWLEIAGAGMVHPEVMRYGGIDPEEYSGFAWGMGIDRLVMLKYNIKDIRQLSSENDLRFLSQFV
jgi:phenylalanyl-tRNA synthetase alpha chain